MARPAGMAIFIQAKRLANKAEVRENDTERPPDADSNEEYSNSKGNNTSTHWLLHHGSYIIVLYYCC
jgi:hypothetical protein